MPTKLIGTAPHQVPRNADLGNLAYQNTDNVVVSSLKAETGVSGFLDAQIGVSGNVRPGIRPVFNADFARSRTLDPRIAFTRNSTATYFDSLNVKAEENLVQYSQDFSISNWSKYQTSIAKNVTTAPDGTITASKVIESTTSNVGHYVAQAIGVTIGATYTFSMFVKAAERTSCALALFSRIVHVDLLNGKIADIESGISDAGILDYDNGWYRIWGTFTATGSSFSFGVYTTNSPYHSTGSAGAYTGDGKSGIFIWGAQLEQRSAVTDYVPTSSLHVVKFQPLLSTALANSPRFEIDPETNDSKGWLIEEQRTNYVLNSQVFTCYPWTFGASTPVTSKNVIGNYVIAPDGTRTASKFIPGTTSSNIQRLRQQIYNLSTSVPYSFSIFLKAAGYKWAKVRLYNAWANFNLESGTIGTSSGVDYKNIKSVGNGWYRCTVSYTPAYANPPIFVYADLSDNNSADNDAFAGDGFSGIYIWGAQVEQVAGTAATPYYFESSYIPTTTRHLGSVSPSTVNNSYNIVENIQPGTSRTELGQNLVGENGVVNYLPSSENFSSWAVETYASVVPHAGIGPDGLISSNLVVFKNVGTNFIYQVMSGSAGWFSTTVTFSVWARSDDPNSTFNLNLGYSSYASQTFTVTKNWKRYSFTTIRNEPSSVSLYALINTSTLANGSETKIHFWGAQVELSAIAQQYVPSKDTWVGRTSTATYFDSAGIMRTAASGQPRYGYNPLSPKAGGKLILEKAATNLCTNSTTSSWGLQGSGGTVITANSTDVAAPDGTYTSTKVDNTSMTDATWSDIIYSNSVIYANTTKTFSIYLRGDPGKTIQLKLDGNGGSGSYVNVVLTNKWQRYSVTYSYPVGYSVVCFLRVGRRDLGGLGTTDATYFYAWGAQLEDGYAASSLIPTSGSTVTRSADAFSSSSMTKYQDVLISPTVTRAGEAGFITGNTFTSLFPQQGGTVYVHGNRVGTGPEHVSFSADMAMGWAIRIATSAEMVRGHTSGGLAATIPWPGSGTPYTGEHKYAVTIANNNLNAAVDGVLATADRDYRMPQFNQFAIGNTYSGNGQGIQYIKKISFYPTILSNSELQGLTA